MYNSDKSGFVKQLSLKLRKSNF